MWPLLPVAGCALLVCAASLCARQAPESSPPPGTVCCMPGDARIASHQSLKAAASPAGTPAAWSCTVLVGAGPTEVSRKKFELWSTSGENRLLWDITLVSSDGRRFHANRLELASWSEYFCRIFCGGHLADMWLVQHLELCKICMVLGLLGLSGRPELGSAGFSLMARWLRRVTRVAWVTERANMPGKCADLTSMGCVLVGSDTSGTPGNPSSKCEHLAFDPPLSSASDVPSASRLMLLPTTSAFCLQLSGILGRAGLAPPAGDYAETKQKTLKLPEDVSADALELLLHGIYAQEVGLKACTRDAVKPSASLRPCTAHQTVLHGTHNVGQLRPEMPGLAAWSAGYRRTERP